MCERGAEEVLITYGDQYGSIFLGMIVAARTVVDGVSIACIEKVVCRLCCEIGNRSAFGVRPFVVYTFGSEEGARGNPNPLNTPALSGYPAL